MASEKQEDYVQAVTACYIAAKVLAQHDLTAVLDAIEKAESVGAMLDPTLYRAKGQAMREDKRAVEAALPLWRLGAKLTARKESKVNP